jgi:NADH oxidase (H2O2-forming)
LLPRRIIIVGCNAAGVNAAIAARKTDRDADIIIFEKGKYTSYSRCGLPFVLAGEIPKFENLVIFPDSYYKMMKLGFQGETTVKSIDAKAKKVEVERKDGGEETFDYDSLILSIGAHPFVPPIKGCDKYCVLPLRTIEDGMMIQEVMKDSKSAVVIGAGLIGLEVAHAFVEKNIETTVVEMLPHVLPAMLDKSMADLFQKEMEQHEVRVIIGKGVDEILGEDRVKGVKVGDETMKADVVVLGTGVRPTTDLAVKAGADVGPSRGIKANQRMMTTIPDVYAAGDCVESYSLINGRPCVCQLGTTAVRQGKVAGVNAAGGYSIFPGVLGSAVSRMFNIEVGATGLTTFASGRAGLKTVAGNLTAKTKAEYFPGAKEIKVKIVADPELGRVLGGQIVAGEDVAQRINMLSLAIENNVTVWELAKADTCYAPPVADTWEPVTLAAEITSRRIKKP